MEESGWYHLDRSDMSCTSFNRLSGGCCSEVDVVFSTGYLLAIIVGQPPKASEEMLRLSHGTG